MSARQYAAHFIPLESNPEVFTDLIHNLGISQELRFEDVLSLDEPEWLPRPALALILVFPTSDTYEQDRVHREAQCKDEENDDQDKDVIWYRQTIHNACGLYAILHAISNGKARSLIQPGSLWATLLNKGLKLETQERALTLETSDELASIYKVEALKGDSRVPKNPEDEVFYHYICFVPSEADSRVYELDGDRTGPIKTEVVLGSDENMLSEKALGLVRAYIDRKGVQDIGFNLMALTQR